MTCWLPVLKCVPKIRPVQKIGDETTVLGSQTDRGFELPTTICQNHPYSRKSAVRCWKPTDYLPTNVPPGNAGSYANQPATSVITPFVSFQTRTCGPPPGPAPVISSSTPSPSMSPAATNVPPGSTVSRRRSRRSQSPCRRRYAPPACGPPPGGPDHSATRHHQVTGRDRRRRRTRGDRRRTPRAVQ